MPSASPLILLASPYSHASRVAAMLGQHPAVDAPPELNFLVSARLVDFFDQVPAQKAQGLLRAIAHGYGCEQTLESIDMARRWIFRRATRDSSEVYRELCERRAPRRLIDASSLYTDPNQEQALERLRALYPDADYLHLVRHPLAQGLAWLRDPLALAQLHQLDSIDRTTPSPLPDPQIDWLRRQRFITAYLRELPAERHYCLRIEELFADARTTLARVCAWLGLEWSEALLEGMRHPERSVYACRGPYGVEGGVDADFMANPRYEPHASESLSLEQPLPWRPDGMRFGADVLDLARVLGYE